MTHDYWLKVMNFDRWRRAMCPGVGFGIEDIHRLDPSSPKQIKFAGIASEAVFMTAMRCAIAIKRDPSGHTIILSLFSKTAS